MEFIEKYLNYNDMDDKNKNDFITEIMKLSYKTISTQQQKLPIEYREDFIGDTILIVVEILSLKKFKFMFFENKDDFYNELLKESKQKIYFKNFVKDKMKDIIINDLIYKKEFVYQVYDKYMSYTFLCKFKAYLDKLIYYLYISYCNKIHSSYLNTQTQEIVSNNSYYLPKIDVKIEFCYLSKEEKQLLQLFLKSKTKIRKSDLSAIYHCSYKSINSKLNKLKEKLNFYL